MINDAFRVSSGGGGRARTASGRCFRGEDSSAEWPSAAGPTQRRAERLRRRRGPFFMWLASILGFSKSAHPTAPVNGSRRPDDAAVQSVFRQTGALSRACFIVDRLQSPPPHVDVSPRERPPAPRPPKQKKLRSHTFAPAATACCCAPSATPTRKLGARRTRARERVPPKTSVRARELTFCVHDE